MSVLCGTVKLCNLHCNCGANLDCKMITGDDGFVGLVVRHNKNSTHVSTYELYTLLYVSEVFFKCFVSPSLLFC